MTNKYIKRHSTSIVINDSQITITTPIIEGLNFKRLITSSVSQTHTQTQIIAYAWKRMKL